MPRRKCRQVSDEQAGEICAFVRARREKARAMHIASQLYGVSVEQIRGILQKYGLMDRHGIYIEPMRITGKEENMPKYYWSAKRKDRLEELYQRGKSVLEIAEEMTLDPQVVTEAIAKFGLNRDPAPPLVPPAVIPPLPEDNDPKPIERTHARLEEIYHLINSSIKHTTDAVSALSAQGEAAAGYQLGQMIFKLHSAKDTIHKLIQEL